MSENNVEFWNIETLKAFSEEEKDVNVLGKYVRIKKINSDIMFRNSGEETMVEQFVEAIVSPKLTKEQIKKLPVEFTKALFEEISAFSGIDAETAEKN